VVLFFAAFGGESGKAAFNNQPRLKHLPELEAVERAHQPQRRLAEFSRALFDEGSDAVPHPHHPHGHEVADTGAQTGAADFEGTGQLALRRDSVARPQSTLLQEGANVVDHLPGSVRIERIVRQTGHKGKIPIILREL
jgi:hypothetical protein